MRRLPSNWLNDIDVTKSVDGLGTVLIGDTVAMRVAKLAQTPVYCEKNAAHVTTLLASPDSGRCAVCKAAGVVSRLGVEEDESESVQVRTIKDETVLSGGTLDGVALRTNPNKSRRPYDR